MPLRPILQPESVPGSLSQSFMTSHFGTNDGSFRAATPPMPHSALIALSHAGFARRFSQRTLAEKSLGTLGWVVTYWLSGRRVARGMNSPCSAAVTFLDHLTASYLLRGISEGHSAGSGGLGAGSPVSPKHPGMLQVQLTPACTCAAW